MGGWFSNQGFRVMLLGFAVLSPTYGFNRPAGRSIRLLAVTRSHRLQPVEFVQPPRSSSSAAGYGTLRLGWLSGIP
jgi:hypothetical protein